MSDPFDDRLASAGRILRDAPEVSSALLALAEARAAEAHNSRRRRLLLPSIIIGSLLTVSGAGAVVATQWQWEITDPDIIVARDWTDTAGTYLGSCESRMATEGVSADALAELRSYLSSLNLDSIAPDPEIVAAELAIAGRPDDLSRLIPGAVAADFDTTNLSKAPRPEWYSDARILQDGLMHEVIRRISKNLEAHWSEYDGVIASGQTQCTTDPSRTVDE
ncbi:MAG: hypothetical protein IT190_00075 [Microbacteriaceae bacterium]|nr:hypothetical protein [Microbacteriaceae bacterium]